MASGIDVLLEFHKGQSLYVIVDHFAHNLVAVSYTGGGKIFRGVLLADNERIGVNEHRASSNASWPLTHTSPEGIVCGTTGNSTNYSSTSLYVKPPPCAVERYTYRTDGQPSRLNVFRSTPKLPPSSCSLLPHTSHHPPLPQHPRVVIRAPRGLARGSLNDFLCRNCKKSLSPNLRDDSTPPARSISKRKDCADRSVTPSKLTSTSSKKRKSGTSDELAASAVIERPKKRLSTPTPEDSPTISKKTIKKMFPTAIAKSETTVLKDKKGAPNLPPSSPLIRCSKDKIKGQPAALIHSVRSSSSPRRSELECIGASTSGSQAAASPASSSFIKRPQRLSYEKPKNRWMHAELRQMQEKKTGVHGLLNPSPSSTRTPQSLPSFDPLGTPDNVPLETSHLAITPPLPPIKIKINRGVVVGNGETEQQNAFEPVNEYQVMPVERPQSPPKSPTHLSPAQTHVSYSSTASTFPPNNSSITAPPSVLSPTDSCSAGLACGERFVKRHRLLGSPSSASSSTVYRIGDVVWGKLAGWPWWPARITSLRRVSDGSSCDACVRWFAWDQVSYFPCDRLWPFLAHHDRKLDKKRAKKRGAYKQAVDEAFTAAKEREASLQAEEGASETDDADNGLGWVFESAKPPLLAPPLKKIRVKRSTAKPLTPESSTDAPVASLPPAYNGLPAQSDESGSEFDGGGPLIIDPHSAPNVPQTPDSSEPRAFPPAHPPQTTTTYPILQQ